MTGGRIVDDEPMAEINMIPLIDIALTLLIIMMVSTSFIRKPGVSLKLPETVTREGAQETSKDLIISILANGNIAVDGKVQNENEIKSRLFALAKQNKEARILLRGDRKVLYERMMEVMDMVRQAGLTRVVLPTDPKTLQQEPPANSPQTPNANAQNPATGG